MWTRLTNNWNLKLTALVLAVVLWSHVRGEINPIETGVFRVPLRAEPPRETLVTGGRPPRFVQVTLRAPRQTLRDLGIPSGVAVTLPNPLAPVTVVTLREDEVRAWVDFGSAQPGPANLAIKAESNVPDAQVIGTDPGVVSLQIDHAARQVRTVRPQLGASPEFTALLGVPSPPTAALYGPSEQLAQVVRVLAPMQVPSRPGTGETETTLRAVDAHGREVPGVVLEPKTVRVPFTLNERMVTRDVRFTVATRGEPAFGYRVEDVSVSPVRLRLRGPVSALATLDIVRLLLDISGARGNLRRRARYILPPHVEALSAARVTLRARIERVPDTTTDQSAVPAPDERGPNGADESDDTPQSDSERRGAALAPAPRDGRGLPPPAPAE